MKGAICVTEEVATATAEPTADPGETSEPAEGEEITLERVENEAMGISVLAPEGWEEAGNGVYVRGDSVSDLTSLIQQAAMGAISLAWQDNALIMDVGEFQAEIQARENDDGEVQYMTWTPPISGVPLELAEDDEGAPTIILGSGVVEYTFVKSE